MKKSIYMVWAVLAVSCSSADKVKVSINNDTDMMRKAATIEVDWQKISQKIPDATPDKIIVKSQNGKQVPSQVIYHGGNTPLSLIFQTDVAPSGSIFYTVETGERENFQPKVFGRFVPERKDDFAWENDIMAFRMYGPALEATGEISNGIDIWVKKTQNLIIDKWYKEDDYHRDHGEGMDCYKVGRTLGAGAMAPFQNDSLYLGNNYVSYKILDQGPIRFTFELTYAPYETYDGSVTEKRIISLDASDRFNKITEQYSKPLNVATGIVLRDGGYKIEDAANGIIGYWEPQNNDSGTNNGHTAIGVIMPGAMNSTIDDGKHLLGITATDNNGEATYYMGAAWSNAGDITSEKEWSKTLNNKKNELLHPLRVIIE